jgi:hypothetical protein
MVISMEWGNIYCLGDKWFFSLDISLRFWGNPRPVILAKLIMLHVFFPDRFYIWKKEFFCTNFMLDEITLK